MTCPLSMTSTTFSTASSPARPEPGEAILVGPLRTLEEQPVFAPCIARALVIGEVEQAEVHLELPMQPEADPRKSADFDGNPLPRRSNSTRLAAMGDMTEIMSAARPRLSRHARA
jgi:hypothetical protein